MKSLRVLGIIGLVLSLLSWICMATLEGEEALGWGFIALLYLIAISIVAIVQGKKVKHIKKSK